MKTNTTRNNIINIHTVKHKQGLVHTIYGNGKGKTTSAIGMAIRAAGAGFNVDFVQFMKDGTSSEVDILKHIPHINYICPGKHEWVWQNQGFSAQQQMHALTCLEYVINCPQSTNMIICDEILNVPLLGSVKDSPFTYDDIIDLIKTKRDDLYIILTGYSCPETISSIADYASMINEIKHPFKKGIMARKGIEY